MVAGWTSRKRCTLVSTNIAGWKNGPGLKMILPLKCGLVYQRVPCFFVAPFCGASWGWIYGLEQLRGELFVYSPENERLEGPKMDALEKVGSFWIWPFLVSTYLRKMLNFWGVSVFFLRIILDGIFAGECVPSSLFFFGCFRVVMIRRDTHGCKNAVKWTIEQSPILDSWYS